MRIKMLSRAVLSLNNRTFGTRLSTAFFVKRWSTTIERELILPDLRKRPVIEKDGPERDLVNFPRPVKQTYSGKVRLGFLPDEWFQFFYKKTGVTGPYLFGAGLVTFLVSKEFYIIDHEFHNGVSFFLVLYLFIKKFGPGIADFADKGIEAEEKVMNDTKASAMKDLENCITDEKDSQQHVLSQKILFNAKRENILLQLEAEYRRRSMQVYEAFKRRLDYQVQLVESKKQIEQKHMVNWIINSVTKSITPQQEADALKKCIADLKQLAAVTH